MTLPAVGNSISFQQIQTEFGGSNPISMNEYGDKIGLTVGTTSTHSINSFYGLSAAVHSSTFSPAFEAHYIPPISTFFYYSGFGTLTTGTITDDTFPNSGTFSDGTTTHSANAVIMTSLEAFASGNSTTANTMILRLRDSSGGIANGGWTTMEVYANTAGTGTPLLSLNRTDATYSSDDTRTPESASWFWSGSYAFSSYFGTNDTPAGSPTHLIRLV
jgi:hypothetical protein